MPKSILIIEDEKSLSDALSVKLSTEGYAVSVAYEGESAITMVEQNSYDLLLLDIIMPKLDGFRFLQKFHELGKTTPVIVLTNLGQNGDLRRSMELGAKEFVVKSDISIDKIVQLTKKYLN